ncbi:MAG: PQQ-binding-like beta-propeller repeat protein [Candidatus Dormibacterales bacterium]
MTRRRILFWVIVLALATNGALSCTESPQPTSGASAPATSPSPPISADWIEYHRNAGRSGQGPSDPPVSSPRVAWTAGVDAAVYASPLIVAGHVIVATENNTVYSLDLFTGVVVWMIHLGTPVDSTSLPCGDIGPVSGITGTPAADPERGRVYVVAFLHSHHHMLFAISLADGSIVWQRDVDPIGSDPTVEQQRGALSVASGYVYVPLGGLYGDCGAYHGYLEAVPLSGAQTLFYRVPSARGAGIWSPQGATIDAAGNVYVVTGNGSSQSSFDFSNAVIELSADLQKVESYFAPPDWAALNAGDADLGSVGVTLMPATGVVLAIGKQGTAFQLSAGDLGGIGGEKASSPVCPGALGGTAWSGTTAFVPCSDGLYAVSLGGGIRVLWHSQHPALGSPILAGGAVWAIEPSSALLFALDPASGAVIYSTGLGSAQQFATPAATEGFVVAPAGSRVVTLATAG